MNHMIEMNQIKAFLDSRKKTSCSWLVLTGNFNQHDTHWEGNKLGCEQCRRLLQFMTFSWCRGLTHWLGRCSVGSVHHRTEETDVKADGSLGCNDYETMKFKLLKKISKNSRRVINNGIKPLYFTWTDFQLSRDLLSRIPLPTTLESRGPAMLLDFQGNLSLCIQTWRKRSKHSRRPAGINHYLLSLKDKTKYPEDG